MRMRLRMIQTMQSPHCGACGDTGKVRNEEPVRWDPESWTEKVDCTECPCCSECGIELRLHPETMECP